MEDAELEQRLSAFLAEIAEVMERHDEVSRGFVLARARAGHPPPAAQAAAQDNGERARLAVEMVRGASERVCIAWGIDPQTGQQVCIQWIDV